jgi:hypothetical protein
LKLGHIGFKDVGVDKPTLVELNRRIQALGATSYMELVSTGAEACVDSARLAAEIGVHRLMGGVEPRGIIDALAGTGVAYFPFVGRPEGHPTRLGGTPEEVAADCREVEALGCAGVDLLAYRATDADPLDLVRAAREALAGILVVAGSVDSPDRIRALASCGADLFTVGTAALTGSFSTDCGLPVSQLERIMDVLS